MSDLVNHSGIVDFVLELERPAGLGMNTSDIQGDTPLHYAYAFGEVGQGEKFHLYPEVDLAGRNMLGMTPLEAWF